MEVDRAIIQPKYVGNVGNGTVVFDIALLKLKDNLDLAEYTPACLPPTNQIFVGETAWVYGWGMWDNDIDEISPVLKETKQVIIKDVECEQIINGHHEFCAFATDSDSCRGDSGGPLTVEDVDEGRHFLVGVVSSGTFPCAKVRCH